MFADVVVVSRFQFASTALYHFIFVPLTIGLSFLLAVRLRWRPHLAWLRLCRH